MPDDSILDAVKQAIAATEDGMTKAEIIDTTGLPDIQGSAVINALVAQGIIAKTGDRRADRYNPAETGGES